MNRHEGSLAYQCSRIFVWIFEMLLAVTGIIFAVGHLKETAAIMLLVGVILYMPARTIVFVSESRRRTRE